MPNTWFQFKRFIVHQDRCAMKVGTDGVLLGAWAEVNNVENILDIGTGTGLIALMLAQRCEARITGVEIDKDAAAQAIENTLRSEWAQRIEILEGRFQEFAQKTTKKWDLIISNPPFFNNSLKAPDHQRTLARHSDTLPSGELLHFATQLLSDNGKFSIILPYNEAQLFIVEAAFKQLYCNQKVFVKPSPNKKANRILMTFSRNRSLKEEKEFSIRDLGNNYTPEYIKLTEDFYLKF